jgi:hypothetical protein
MLNSFPVVIRTLWKSFSIVLTGSDPSVTDYMLGRSHYGVGRITEKILGEHE